MGLKESSTESIIEELCTETAKVCVDVKNALWDWPFPPIYENFYLGEAYLKRLYETIKELREAGLSQTKMAMLLRNPSRISQLFYLIFNGKFSGLSPNERKDLFISLYKFVASLRKDPFCRNGVNQILTDDEVKDIVKFCNFQTADIQTKSTIGRINAALWQYCEMLHFAMHPIVHEFHGPYDIGNRKSLVVREYYDLRPEAVWPYTTNFPYEEMLLHEIYEGFSQKYNFMNHTVTSDPFPQRLQKIHVSVLQQSKWRVVEIRDLDSILASILNSIVEGMREVKNYSKKDMLRKYVEMHYLILKPLTDLLSKDWTPPKEQYEFIETQELDKAVLENMAKLAEIPRETAVTITKDILLKNIIEE